MDRVIGGVYVDSTARDRQVNAGLEPFGAVTGSVVAAAARTPVAPAIPTAAGDAAAARDDGYVATADQEPGFRLNAV